MDEQQIEGLRAEVNRQGELLRQWDDYGRTFRLRLECVEHRLAATPLGERHGWIKDACALSGLGVLGAGCWLVSPATSLVVIGGLLVGWTMLGTVAQFLVEARHARSD